MAGLRKYRLSYCLAAMIALTGCNGGGTALTGASHSESGLRLVPLTITMGERAHNFTVEVAATEDEQARGLMLRTSMAPNSGMVFPFSPPRFASFWMKNTLIPLDMLFVRADGTIDRIAENTTPESLDPVGSGGEVIAVLELNGGTAARLGIDENAIVRWTDDRIRR